MRAARRLSAFREAFQLGHGLDVTRRLGKQVARGSSTRSVAAVLWPRARVAQRRGYNTTSTSIGSR